MDKLIAEIEAYVARAGITPQKLLRDVIAAPWGQWQKWKAGASSPTMRSVDKIREYMATNHQPAAPAAPSEDPPHVSTPQQS